MSTFQSILGSLLYYGHMVDLTTLASMDYLDIGLRTVTFKTKEHMNTLLDSLRIKPNATMLCRKSDMMMKVHYDQKLKQ